MSSYPAWTPASKVGIIPLHPQTFGQILGRTFTALRHNPKVLLGFAVLVQGVVSSAILVGLMFALTFTFQRLETLSPASEDYDTIVAGSIALVGVLTLVMTILLQSFTVIVQGVVSAEVGAAILAEKLTLGQVWARVRPVMWRLIGYTLLLGAAMLVAVGIPMALVAVLIATLGSAGAALGVLMFFVLFAGILVGSLWISTKLAFVSSIIVLERSKIIPAIRRSWRLTRGRFWPILGITMIISIAFNFASQAVSGVISLISMLGSGVLAPTAAPPSDSEFFLRMMPAMVASLVVSTISTVVIAAAATILYADARMRAEGLDITLLGYVERRDAGQTNLPDPYAPGDIPTRPAQYPPAQYPQAQQYGQYPTAQYPQAQQYGQYPTAQYPQAQQYGQYPAQPQAQAPAQQYGQYPTAPQYPAQPQAQAPAQPQAQAQYPTAPQPTATPDQTQAAQDPASEPTAGTPYIAPFAPPTSGSGGAG